MGGLRGCSVGTRSHTWALRAGNTALPPRLGDAPLPGCRVTEQRGPWWMAGKLEVSALASGACCDVSGSILSVRAATKPCGGVTAPPAARLCCGCACGALHGGCAVRLAGQ